MSIGIGLKHSRYSIYSYGIQLNKVILKYGFCNATFQLCITSYLLILNQPQVGFQGLSDVFILINPLIHIYTPIEVPPHSFLIVLAVSCSLPFLSLCPYLECPFFTHSNHIRLQDTCQVPLTSEALLRVLANCDLISPGR